jgi:2Fe-2S ferredoxin
MPSVNITTRDGGTHVVEGATDLSIMETIRDAGFDELQALCGGSCSCATCHVYVEESFRARLSPMSSDEDELLGSSSFRKPTSRLSCQIRLSPELDGIVLTIAPEE